MISVIRDKKTSQGGERRFALSCGDDEQHAEP
jgi:hypothetical protein